MSLEHPTWKCHEETLCKICKSREHITGSWECEAYTSGNGAYTFGGRNDPLGLSNFAECNFTYKGQNYKNREIAFQHQRALETKQNELAEEILKAESPHEAKYLSRCLTKQGMWNKESSVIMYDICVAAANENDTYRSNILKTRDRYLAESISGNYFWSTGLSHKVTKQTIISMFPGENEMGKILMRVRDLLNLQENDKYNKNTEEYKEVSSSPASSISTNVTNNQTNNTPVNSGEKPQVQQKPDLKRKPTSSPLNTREDKKIDNNITPTSTFNSQNVLDESIFSPTLNNPVKNLQLPESGEEE